MRTGDDHYVSDLVGGAKGLPGAGLLGWLTGDQLHPPMLPDEEMWRNGARWHEGAQRYIVELGQAAGLSANEHVLDIGCGLCGPARVLVDNFGVEVTAVTNSRAHVATSEEINAKSDVYRRKIKVVYAADLASWPDGMYDVAWSVNMLYQVYNHQELFGRVSDLLGSGARFLVDDWMATSTITEADLRSFQYHFQYRNFARLGAVESELAAVGFWPASTVLDRGDIGRGVMATYFEQEMRGYFLPQLSTQWPDSLETPISGRRMALDFVDAVNQTLRL